MSSAEMGREGRKRRKSKRLHRDGDVDLDLPSDTKRVISELMIKINEEAEKGWQKKRDETMKRVASKFQSSEFQSMFDNVKSKLEEERQKFVEAVLKHTDEKVTTLSNSLKEMPQDGIFSSTLYKYLCSLVNASDDHASMDD